MAVRGIRGATTAEANTKDAIVEATDELLRVLVERNNLEQSEIASAWFTTTVDLTAEYPALAARQLGWLDVPLICGHEMAVQRPPWMTIRVLLHYNTGLPQAAIHHVYLRGATVLRRDLVARFGAGPPE